MIPGARDTKCMQHLIVFVVSLAVLSLAGSQLGLTWDEATYISYVDELRAAWSRGLTPDFHGTFLLSSYLNPHPPLQKWGAYLLSPRLEPVLGFLPSWRLMWQVWVAGQLTLTFHLVRTRSSIWAALSALLIFAGSPRLLGYSSMAMQDGLLMTSWANVALLGSATTSSSSRRHWTLLALTIVCCVAAKVTGILVVVPLGITLLIRRQWKATVILAGLVSLAVIFSVAINPENWGSQMVWAPYKYLAYPFTRHSVPISFFYMNRPWLFNGPWHWGIAIFAATSPPIPFFVAMIGLGGSITIPRLRPFIPHHLLWLALMSLPTIPRHDDIRQFLPGIMVFLLSGVFTLESIRQWIAKKTVSVATMALLIASAISSWYGTWQFPLSYYSPLVGNLEGAEKLGFDVTLYFEALKPELLHQINDQLPPGTPIFQLPQWSYNLECLQKHGMLRNDFHIFHEPVNTSSQPGFLLLFHRKAMLPEKLYMSGTPLFEYDFRGVSLIRGVLLPPTTPLSPSSQTP